MWHNGRGKNIGNSACCDTVIDTVQETWRRKGREKAGGSFVHSNLPKKPRREIMMAAMAVTRYAQSGGCDSSIGASVVLILVVEENSRWGRVGGDGCCVGTVWVLQFTYSLDGIDDVWVLQSTYTLWKNLVDVMWVLQSTYTPDGTGGVVWMLCGCCNPLTVSLASPWELLPLVMCVPSSHHHHITSLL